MTSIANSNQTPTTFFDELDSYLRVFLRQEARKFLRQKDGKIFLFNREKGIFDPLPTSNTEIQTFLLNTLEKPFQKFFINHYPKIFKTINLKSQKDKKLPQKIFAALQRKILLNPTIYAPPFDFDESEIAIPLNDGKTFKLKHGRTFSDDAKARHQFFFHLDLHYQQENFFEDLLGHSSSAYFNFLQELSAANQNILQKTITLIRNCVLNIPCETHSVYVIVHEGSKFGIGILQNYLEPIINLFPNQFVGYVNTLSKQQYKFRAMLAKRINIVKGSDLKFTDPNKRFIHDFLLDGSYFTDDDGTNFLNTTLHIVHVDKENLPTVQKLLPENSHERLEYIYLPAEIDQKWLEPDQLEFFKDEPFQILRLTGIQIQINPDEPQKITATPREFLSSFESFYSEKMEITGKLSDEILKKDLFSAYKDYCTETGQPMVSNTTFGKRLKEAGKNLYCEKADWAGIVEEAKKGKPFFASHRKSKSPVAQWVGLRLKN